MPARVVVQEPELAWKGEWSPAVTYPRESVVGYEGSSYVASEITQGAEPTQGGPWSLVAEKGDKGDKGDPGISGDAAARTPDHIQNNDALVWVVPHNLGYDPAVEVIDSAGTTVATEVVYTIPGEELEVRNVYQFSGRAILA